MSYLQKPESYIYWLKKVFRGCFPMTKDFEGVWNALLTLFKCILTLSGRLVILLTSFVSVPLLAWLMKGLQERTMKRRAKLLSEDFRGFGAVYSKEDVERVLKGEVTQEELDAIKEKKFNEY